MIYRLAIPKGERDKLPLFFFCCHWACPCVVVVVGF
jgi:hypothetical protein